MSIYWLTYWRFTNMSMRLYVINRGLQLFTTPCILVQTAYDKLWKEKPKRSWWVGTDLRNHHAATPLPCISYSLPSSMPVLGPTLPDILVPLMIVKPLFLFCLWQRSTFFGVWNDVGVLCFTSNSLQLIMKGYIPWQFWKYTTRQL